jgi:hypothetical protein
LPVSLEENLHPLFERAALHHGGVELEQLFVGDDGEAGFAGQRDVALLFRFGHCCGFLAGFCDCKRGRD